MTMTMMMSLIDLQLRQDFITNMGDERKMVIMIIMMVIIMMTITMTMTIILPAGWMMMVMMFI